MKDIEIKQIGSDSVQQFFELYKAIANSAFHKWTEKSKQHWFEQDYSPEYWKEMMEKEHLPVLVAFIGDKMVGYVMIEGINFGVGYLGWIGVLKEHQKHGIGDRLLSAIEDWCKNNNIHKIELETQEPELQHFYEKNGYNLEGIRKNSWQNLDNYMFGKQLV